MKVEFNEDDDGFWAKFDNGWTMSVQWGLGNYMTNAKTAEIAAWDEDDTLWWDFIRHKPVPPCTEVLGHVRSDELGGYLDEIASITRSSYVRRMMRRMVRSIREYFQRR